MRVGRYLLRQRDVVGTRGTTLGGDASRKGGGAPNLTAKTPVLTFWRESEWEASLIERWRHFREHPGWIGGHLLPAPGPWVRA